MKLTAEQIVLLSRAMDKLESADYNLQSALPAGDLCYDLHNRIEDLCAEIEQILEEEELPEMA